MRHVSTTVMIQRLSGMLDTPDLNKWEQEFVKNLKHRADLGEVTQLSEKQVERLDELHGKHFGGPRLGRLRPVPFFLAGTD